MIARVVDNVLSSRRRPVVVVTGHRGDEMRAALGGRPVTFVDAPDYAQGLSASLKAGIAGLPAEASPAALVCLGDMPLVTGADAGPADRRLGPRRGPRHRGADARAAPATRCCGAARYFPEMLGAGRRCRRPRAAEAARWRQVAEVEIGDDAVLRDFDTVESLATLPQRLRPADVGRRRGAPDTATCRGNPAVLPTGTIPARQASTGAGSSLSQQKIERLITGIERSGYGTGTRVSDVFRLCASTTSWWRHRRARQWRPVGSPSYGEPDHRPEPGGSRQVTAIFVHRRRRRASTLGIGVNAGHRLLLALDQTGAHTRVQTGHRSKPWRGICRERRIVPGATGARCGHDWPASALARFDAASVATTG